MLRGFGTLAVAVAVGLFAVGDLSAQTGTTQQQPTGQQTQTDTTQAQSSKGPDEAEARQRLVEARETLAELAKMPEASQLQGQPRTEVTEAIANFNSLLTAEANWYEDYKKVMQNLHNVLGPAQEGAAGTTGAAAGAATTGTAGAGGEEIPAELRSKLTEFRQRLMAFGRAADAPDVTGGITAAEPSATAGTAGAAQGAAGTAATQGTAGAAGETLEHHLDAISSIIQEATSAQPSAQGTAGTAGATGTAGAGAGKVMIDREKLDRIQTHLQKAKEIAREKGVK